MKITYEGLKIMLLRPALYNGKEFEADIEFTYGSLFRAKLYETDALAMPSGDTTKIPGKISFEEEKKYEQIPIYMSADVLTRFIEEYGIHRINATVGMKLKLVYAIYTENSSTNPVREDLIAFELVGLPPKN